MSGGRIASYEVDPHAIASFQDEAVLTPEPRYPGWRNFVSQASVRAMAIAPQSRHMWLATWGGVLSWDRRREPFYRRYSSEHGLVGNAVACICVDADERAWAGPLAGGLCYFHGDGWQVYGDEQLQGERVRALCSAGARGGIWAATADAVYHIPDADSLATPIAAGAVHGTGDALALLAEAEGLLLGNAGGLFRLRPGAEPERLFPETIESCVALARDRRNRVWVALPEALCRLTGNDLSVYRPETDRLANRIDAIAAGRDRVWVQSSAGLAYFEEGRWSAVPWTGASQTEPAVRAIAASTDDAYLWVGTEQRLMGVYCPMGQPPRWDPDLMPAHRDDALNNLLRCITGPTMDGRIWSGSAGALYAFAVDDSWETPFPGNDIRTLDRDGQGVLWLLAWPYGVYQSSRLQRPIPPLPGLPQLLRVGQDGQAYCLTGRALWRLDADQWTEVLPGSPAMPLCLEQTSDGIWWLGTDRGLYRQAGGRWDFCKEEPGPLAGGIYDLATIDGRLWVAGESGLWARQGNGNEWTGHGLDEQDRSLGVWALAAADAGRLWLAREDGVVRYDPGTGAVDDGYRFTPADSGLASLRVTAMQQTARHLWICTQAGLSRFQLSG